MGTNAKFLIPRDKPPVKPSAWELWRWAEAYLQLGWKVLPCYLTPPQEAGKEEWELCFPFRWTRFRDVPIAELRKLWRKWAFRGLRTKHGLLKLGQRFPWGLGAILDASGLLKLDADNPEAVRYLKKMAYEYGIFYVPTREDESRGHFYMRLPRLDSLPRYLVLPNGAVVEVQGRQFSPLPLSPHRKRPYFALRWEIPSFWHMPEMVAGSVPEPPPEIVELLQEQLAAEAAGSLEISLSIAPLKRKKFLSKAAAKGNVADKVIKLLQELDLIRGRFSTQKGEYWRLQICPFCWDRGTPTKNDNPYCSVNSLFFFCFRARCGCPAHERPQPPHKALPRLEEMLRRRDEVMAILARIRR